MVSVVGLSEMLFSAVYDRILWNRTFGWMTLAGMALVAAPTAWLLATSRRSSAESPGSPDLPGLRHRRERRHVDEAARHGAGRQTLRRRRGCRRTCRMGEIETGTPALRSRS